MGIPSYYKRLCDTVPGLLQKKCTESVQNFFLDFNCLIYYCIRRNGTSLGEYEGDETRVAWEDCLIHEVGVYVKQLVDTVEPSGLVYLAIDGVVPMSKMRQQRLRRFKSHWMHEQEISCGKPAKPRWDTNSITPGTAFMERLSVSLQTLCKQQTAKTGVKWILSDATEPGEGEQKVFSLLRKMREEEGESTLTGAQVVYGLDADLIVLSLLESLKLKTPLWLFREAMESGMIKQGVFGEEYRYLNVHKLAEYLSRVETDMGKKANYLLNYCMGMSLLGNDFLPHGLGLTMKHGGHDALLQLLRDMKNDGSGCTLIDRETGSWSQKGLQYAFGWLAAREEDAVKRMLQSKVAMQTSPVRVEPGAEPWAAAIEKWMRTPVHWLSESPLIQSIEGTGRETVVNLREEWQGIYEKEMIGIHNENDRHRVCNKYLEGLEWILQYYTGGRYSPTWMFPWHYPPTWKSLYLNSLKYPSESICLNADGEFVKPQEQLALVLPLKSFWLIRDTKLRGLPKRAPQLWTDQFHVMSGGRSLMWECEAEVPLFTPERLRFLLQ